MKRLAKPGRSTDPNSPIDQLHQLEKHLRIQASLFPGPESEYLLLAISPSGIIDYISRNARLYFGFSAKTMTGQPIYDYLAKDDAFQLDQLLTSLNHVSLTSKNVSIRFKRKNQTTWSGECRFAPLRIDGSCTGMVGMIRDRSDSDALEKQPNAENRMVRALNAFSLEIASAPDENLLKIIGESILKNLNSVLMWISFFDSATGDLVVQHITSTKPDDPIIHYLIENRLCGGRRHVPDTELKIMIGQQYMMTGSCDRAMLGALPLDVCDKVVETLDIGWFLGVALVHETSLLGTMVIAGKRTSPVRDREETLAYAGVTANAIHRLLARKASKVGEERFRKLVRNSGDMMAILDPDGRFLFIGGSIESVTGYESEELIETGIYDRTHPEDIQTVRNLLAPNHVPEHGSHRVEFRFQSRDGSWKMLEAVSSNLVGDPVINGIILNIRNLSDRKQAEEILRQTTELYRLVVENANDMIVVSRGSYILFANSNTYRILGYDQHELFSKPFPELLHPEDRADAMERYRRICEGVSVPKAIMRVLSKDGAFHWTEAIGIVIDWNNQPAVISFVSDITERYQMELALRASEKRFSDYIRLAPIAVTIADAEGKITEANPAACEMSGYSADELIGKTLFDLAVPEYHEIILSKLKEVSRSGHVKVVHPIIHKSGHLVWIEAETVSIDGDQSIAFTKDVTAQIRNTGMITAQKNLATAIARSRNFADTLMLCLNSAIQLGGLDCGGIYLINPANQYLELMVHTGLSPEFVRSVLEYAPGSFEFDLIIKAAPIYLTSSETIKNLQDRGLGIELRAMAVFPIECDGEVIGCLNVGSHNSDTISEESRIILETIASELGPTIARQSSINKLQERENNLAALFNTTQDIILVMAVDGRLLEANPIAERLLGYTRPDLLGMNLMDLLPLEHRAPAAQKLSLLSEKQNLELSVPFITSGNLEVPMEIHMTPGQWNNQPACFAVSRDIRERLRHEEMRIQLEHQLLQSQKLESLGIMAGGVAHDFNNILMAMLGYTELALLKLTGSSDVRKHLEQIQKNIHRASDLTRQMLAYAGKASFVMENINLEKLVRSQSELIEALVSRNIILTYEFDPELPEIKGDPNQIQHVIMNILMNASEAIRDRAGVIRITGSRIHLVDSDIAVSGWLGEVTPGDYIMLSVSDTGCGMDKETMSRVFEPFFSTKFAGRGLGLASVHGIVIGHKGAVRVLSEPGKGTTFELLLPITEAAYQAVFRYDRPASDMSPKGGLVMVAEDEEDLREISVEILHNIGFTVIAARDGQEAIDLFLERQKDIRLVILDMTMPVKSGAEVLEFIQQLTPETRIILTSGYNRDDVLNKFRDSRIAGFLSKPYSFEDLKQAVSRAFSNPGIIDN